MHERQQGQCRTFVAAAADVVCDRPQLLGRPRHDAGRFARHHADELRGDADVGEALDLLGGQQCGDISGSALQTLKGCDPLWLLSWRLVRRSLMKSSASPLLCMKRRSHAAHPSVPSPATSPPNPGSNLHHSSPGCSRLGPQQGAEHRMPTPVCVYHSNGCVRTQRLQVLPHRAVLFPDARYVNCGRHGDAQAPLAANGC